LLQAAQTWVRDAQRSAPVNDGYLRRNITFKDISQGENVGFEVVSGSDYSAYMEFGTKSKFQAIPGIDSSVFIGENKKSNIKLKDAIFYWVKRKKIGLIQTKSGGFSKSQDSLRAQKSAAFLIARSIYKKGVRPHPYFFQHLDKVKKIIEDGLKFIQRKREL